MNEEWRSVVGHEGYYEVSNRGRVRSVSRKLSDGRPWFGRVISQYLRPNSYASVNLCRDGRGKTANPHRMVLEAFVGPCPVGMEGCHNDGDRYNNNLENLRWDTHKENCIDRTNHGAVRSGERHAATELCKLDVWLIRNCKLSGVKMAKFFDVSDGSISLIRSYVRWKHV